MFAQESAMDSPAGSLSSENGEGSSSIRLHEPAAGLLSPSIQREAGEAIDAFELKFLLPHAIARQVQHWATQNMLPDPFANPRLGGAYLTTTLYLDTPQRDVFYRADGHRRRKFRLRRYGIEPRVYLERKTRGNDRVKKRRSEVPLHELHARLSLPPASVEPEPEAWPGEWFCTRVEKRGLRPACVLSYHRTAFVQPSAEGTLRLTLDRDIRGSVTANWDLTPLAEGHRILPDHTICEFKFRGALPNLFKEVILNSHLEARGVSKYRQMMIAAGAAAVEDRRHA
jgi:hypothetical protein